MESQAGSRRLPLQGGTGSLEQRPLLEVGPRPCRHFTAVVPIYYLQFALSLLPVCVLLSMSSGRVPGRLGNGMSQGHSWAGSASSSSCSEAVTMQAVILAGGLGTRLRPLTNGVPKAMVMVHGKPFLEYQVRLLRNGGITSLVLCIGHLGQHIREYFGDGGKYGVDIRYSDDGDTLLGTAGALKRAEPLLADDFFLIYGDSYLFLDYRAIMDYFRQRDKLALMVVYRNEDSREPSNVVTDGESVLAYDKETRTADMTHINFGASVIRKQALTSVPTFPVLHAGGAVRRFDTKTGAVGIRGI